MNRISPQISISATVLLLGSLLLLPARDTKANPGFIPSSRVVFNDEVSKVLTNLVDNDEKTGEPRIIELTQLIVQIWSAHGWDATKATYIIQQRSDGSDVTSKFSPVATYSTDNQVLTLTLAWDSNKPRNKFQIVVDAPAATNRDPHHGVYRFRTR